MELLEKRCSFQQLPDFLLIGHAAIFVFQGLMRENERGQVGIFQVLLQPWLRVVVDVAVVTRPGCGVGIVAIKDHKMVASTVEGIIPGWHAPETHGLLLVKPPVGIVVAQHMVFGSLKLLPDLHERAVTLMGDAEIPQLHDEFGFYGHWRHR